MSKAEIKQKIDSLTAVRIKESDAQSQLDLQHRISIEVKVKADSIADALIKQQAKDSAKAKLAPVPAKPHVAGNI